MNSKKFKSQLNKLSTIFASIEADGQISELEQDLLKKYVVNLYDALLDSDSKSEPKKSQKQVKEAAIVERPQSVEGVKEAEVVEETMAVAEKQPEAKMAVPVIAKKEVIEPIKRPEPAQVKQTYSIPSKLKEIFEAEEAVELSDKLRLAKVTDIRKSMGINEKIFTIKELFGGDQEKFNEVMSSIEACKDYDEASKYLSKTIASDQNWSEDGKLKKAKQFVKLVQRKFV